MDDEDGRCLLDVICDPQALNDFLHGSEKLDGDDLLDNPGEAQSAFYEGPGLHVQEASGNHLNPEPSQPAPSVDLDFLEDDILGSPSAGGGGGGGGSADQPCDILQQSLQEANITEQTLEAEAELALGPFQLPTLQPADTTHFCVISRKHPAGAPGPQALFPGGTDLLGLQAPPTVLTHQALVPPQDVVNKALSERSQQPLSAEGPHLSVPASVIVSAPAPAQDPAPTTPVAKGAGLGPQTPDGQASPAPAPQAAASLL
ncbi:PREDICTED: glioma tumor suppressor candidate region gene 1 protein [Myotis davidii]|uniref:glioma tumor suppressor candidate region gene 1 protein n=1 Tax=Myotis davidii TaxID=225400 RepID=UPI0003EC6217|nr:PREDICTED: glioma tumor suppressor candidate region gene 1 protein [Myotis davidii]